MGLLGKLLGRGSKDPYWDAFINRTVADPKNDITGYIRTSPPGNPFPVRSEIPEPPRMAADLHDLATFLGASAIGVVATSEASLTPADDGDTPLDLDELTTSHPFLIMCTVPAEYDPTKAPGIGGQHAAQASAKVNFSVAAYIRELGYLAIVHPVDSVKAAVEAGIGSRRADGRLTTKKHGANVYVGDGVLTDLPLALGNPKS